MIEYEEPTVKCEHCGHPIYELACKIICPNCGARRDCSDP